MSSSERSSDSSGFIQASSEYQGGPDIPTAAEVAEQAPCPDCHEDRTYYNGNEEGDRWVCFSDECQAKNVAEKKAAARRVRIENLDELVLQLGVPARYAHCKRSSWDGPWPDQGLYGWKYSFDDPSSDKFPSMTLISGLAGVGKTHIATALFRRGVASFGSLCIWVSTMDYLEGCREAISDPQSAASMRRIAEATVLVLDDMGTNTVRQDTTWQMERIAWLLCHRYDEMLPTIITTNNTPEELSKMDAHLASRILSESVALLGGKDRRIG